MGIDRSELSASAATMLDQRAQLFNISNGWSPNQVSSRQLFAMDVVNNMTDANRPLGTGVPLSSTDFVDFGNSSPNRLPSVRSSSTDSFNDPDGPAMNNGNGNCQTPDFDDSAYDNPLGTPNSFIEEQPHSPDMFSEGRQRLMSTSSSFTYSPYSPYEEGQTAIGLPPGLDRQTSLAMVEEVLGSTEDCSNPLMFFPKDDSPLLEASEDSCLPPYPSPSFVEHFNANNNLAENFITASQGEEFYATFSGTDGPSTYCCDGSPTTESSPAANSNNNNCSNDDAQTSSVQEATVTCTEETGTVQYPQQPLIVATSAMERQNTNLSDILTSSMPQDSLDAQAMMQDFYNTLPSSQTAITTVNVEVLADVPVTESNNGQLNIENPSTSATLQPKSPTTLENSNTYIHSNTNVTDIATVRRERNNAACRQSRKRRKEKKQELENQASFFAKENEQLKVKIEELEVECKRVKQSIMGIMANNINRNNKSR